MKHTKGKWGIKETGLVSAPLEVKKLNNIGGLTICKVHERNPGEALANAKLIASAPELLEALKEAHEWIFNPESHGSKDVRSLLHKTGQAIKKATE